MLANSSNPGNVFNVAIVEVVVACSAWDVVVVARRELAVVEAGARVDEDAMESAIEVDIADRVGVQAASKSPPRPKPPSRKALRRSITC